MMNSIHKNYYLYNPYDTLLSIATGFCSLLWALAEKAASLVESIFDQIDNYFYNAAALLPLRVTLIDPKDFPTTLKTVAIWKRFAEKQNLGACKQLCMCLLEQMQRNPLSFDEAYACIDARKELQGVLLLSLDKRVNSENPAHQGRFVKINYLVTRPQQNHDKVKGAGSLLVDCAQKRSIERHQDGVLLESIPSAEKFYEKLGFEKMAVSSTEDQCQPMLRNRLRIS